MSTQLVRIAEKAKSDPQLRFSSLAHAMSEEFLMETWTKLNRRGAVGVDRETMDEFSRNLGQRIQDLHQRLVDGTYRAPPVRAVEIPKSNGKFRTLGIPTVEDRLVQAAVARLLSAVFEPVFLDSSYGFRPGRNAHQALQALREQIVCRPVMHVYEADIRSFFDRVSHQWLRRMLRQRVADKTILRLIDKWLRAGVMQKGLISVTDDGVPQGGPVTPPTKLLKAAYTGVSALAEPVSAVISKAMQKLTSSCLWLLIHRSPERQRQGYDQAQATKGADGEGRIRAQPILPGLLATGLPEIQSYSSCKRLYGPEHGRG